MNATKLSALIAAGCFVAYALLALLVTSPGMPPTGDEPHYLMVAHSLAVDGDLSLKENYLNREYRVFYPGVLAKRTTLAPDRTTELPAFGPGLALFLAPFYRLALAWFPGLLVPFLRLVICATAALGIYHVLRLTLRFADESQARTAALAAVPVFALASPMVTYCSMFYPEIVAFLLLVLCVRRLDEIVERPLRSGMWLAVLAPALIWLHPKYLALSFLVLAFTSYSFYRIRNTAGRSLPVLVPLVQLAGIVAFFLVLHSVYGSWSPNRIYGGAQRDTSLLELLTREGFARLAVMLKMLIGYWIDQRFGILVYAPAYAAFFPALAWCWRRLGLRAAPAAVLFAAHFLLISWGAQMGGYAPPSRHFVVLVPLMLPFILCLVPEWSRMQKALFCFLSVLGLAVSALILTHYRLIFTNATWRNPDGYSEFWSWLHMQHGIPRLTSTPPDAGLALAWIATAALLGILLYPRRSQVAA